MASSSTTTQIPPHKTQLHPRMTTTTTTTNPLSLFPKPTPNKPQTYKTHNQTHRHKHILITIVTLSLLSFSLYLLLSLRLPSSPSSSAASILIEISGPTSHSRSHLRIFRSFDADSGTPLASDSFWAGSGSGREVEVVGEMVEVARGKVPKSQWKATRVQLVVVDGGEWEAGTSRVVLEECRGVLRSSGFLFRDHWASLLTGQDEGFYNWLAVNYALGYIGNKPQDTAGVIVLGRSAMQVTYASSESPPSKFSRIVRFAGVSYNLYTQSLQQFGQDALWKLLHEQDSQDLKSSSENNERTVSNPCVPRGYEPATRTSDEKLVKSLAAGNFSNCKSEVMTLLNGKQGICANPPCELTLSILDELERKPHPQQRFFLSSQLRGLVPKASVSGLEDAGQQFCEDDWEKLKRHHDIEDIDLSRSCFSHAFMAVLLHNSYGIPLDTKRVEFAAGSTPIDWRLGAFLSQTIMEPPENEVHDQETEIVGSETITYFLFFAVVLVFVLLATFFVMKLRKPQLKTIYDLEKGRYIVTRVPR